MPTTSNSADASQPSPNLLEDYLDKNELAAALDTSPRTVDRWETARIGPPRTIIGRRVLFRRESVKQWLLQRERGAEDARRARSRHRPPKQRDAAGKAG
jgi:predicted DNA-binding transcriptional regulator AlpA